MPIKQQGAVLILVLWFISFASLLIITMASEVKFIAKAVSHQTEHLQHQADMQKALYLAQLQLLWERMPPEPKSAKDKNNKKKKPLLQFNGQALKLIHPDAPKNIEVRIYDHAGRLNLRQFLDRLRIDDLLKRQWGGDIKPSEFQALQQAWQDWKDKDDNKRVNGAEKNYYAKQGDYGYRPRNDNNIALESLDEVRLIKGFDKIFKDVHLDTIFTLHGNQNKININLASSTVLRFIPGLSAKAVNQILTKRTEEPFTSLTPLKEMLSPSNYSKASPWLYVSDKGSQIYTIALIPKIAQKSPKKTATQASHAYQVTVQLRGNHSLPKVLRVDPYRRLP